MMNQRSAFERTLTAMVIAWLILAFPVVDARAQDENGNGEPVFPYGAVYFRKSNPPMEDWERDYGTAAQDGMNAFRHWFLWSAIEVAPGESTGVDASGMAWVAPASTRISFSRPIRRRSSIVSS